MAEIKPEAVDGRVTQTVWVLTKDGHTMTCIISGEVGREDLQVLFDREVFLDEPHSVHDGAVGRARTLLHGFQARGWVQAARRSSLKQEFRIENQEFRRSAQHPDSCACA